MSEIAKLREEIKRISEKVEALLMGHENQSMPVNTPDQKDSKNANEKPPTERPELQSTQSGQSDQSPADTEVSEGQHG